MRNLRRPRRLLFADEQHHHGEEKSGNELSATQYPGVLVKADCLRARWCDFLHGCGAPTVKVSHTAKIMIQNAESVAVFEPDDAESGGRE